MSVGDKSQNVLTCLFGKCAVDKRICRGSQPIRKRHESHMGKRPFYHGGGWIDTNSCRFRSVLLNIVLRPFRQSFCLLNRHLKAVLRNHKTNEQPNHFFLLIIQESPKTFSVSSRESRIYYDLFSPNKSSSNQLLYFCICTNLWISSVTSPPLFLFGKLLSASWFTFIVLKLITSKVELKRTLQWNFPIYFLDWRKWQNYSW